MSEDFDEGDWLAARFEEHRGRLRAIAYRMLGSLSEAEDAVQDAWLRLSRSGVDGVENLGAWLTTIVARVCLNMLQARTARKDKPVGVHLPDPWSHSTAGRSRSPPSQSPAAGSWKSTRSPTPNGWPACNSRSRANRGILSRRADHRTSAARRQAEKLGRCRPARRG